MGVKWRYETPENWMKYIQSHKKYLSENIVNKRIRLGKITCPKCGKQGYLRLLKRKNRATGNRFSPNYEVEHYKGFKNGKRIYEYCHITKLMRVFVK